jgi:hypothetical protein
LYFQKPQVRPTYAKLSHAIIALGAPLVLLGKALRASFPEWETAG